MRKLVVLVMTLSFISMAYAEENPFLENVKSKHQEAMGKSSLFKIVSSYYDKQPSTQGMINTYELKLKVKGKAGNGSMTFVKYPSASSKNEKEDDIPPLYKTVTLKVAKYTDKVNPMEKKPKISLHLVENETIAVYPGQLLTITWHGDGGLGERGFHLFSYLEKLE